MIQVCKQLLRNVCICNYIGFDLKNLEKDEFSILIMNLEHFFKYRNEILNELVQ